MRESDPRPSLQVNRPRENQIQRCYSQTVNNWNELLSECPEFLEKSQDSHLSKADESAYLKDESWSKLQERVRKALQTLSINESSLSQRSWILNQEFEQLSSEISFIESKINGIVSQALETVKRQYQTHIEQRISVISLLLNRIDAERSILGDLQETSSGRSRPRSSIYSNSNNSTASAVKDLLDGIETDPINQKILNSEKLSNRIAHFLNTPELSEKISNLIYDSFQVKSSSIPLESYFCSLEGKLTKVLELQKTFRHRRICRRSQDPQLRGSRIHSSLIWLNKSLSKKKIDTKAFRKVSSDLNGKKLGNLTDNFVGLCSIAPADNTQSNQIRQPGSNKDIREERLRLVFDKILQSNDINICRPSKDISKLNKGRNNCASLFKSIFLTKPHSRNSAVQMSNEVENKPSPLPSDYKKQQDLTLRRKNVLGKQPKGDLNSHSNIQNSTKTSQKISTKRESHQPALSHKIGLAGPNVHRSSFSNIRSLI